MTHHDPAGPYGFAPYGSMWVTRAEESPRPRRTRPTRPPATSPSGSRAGLPMDAYRLTHYRRNKAAEQYAHAVYVERVRGAQAPLSYPFALAAAFFAFLKSRTFCSDAGSTTSATDR